VIFQYWDIKIWFFVKPIFQFIAFCFVVFKGYQILYFFLFFCSWKIFIFIFFHYIALHCISFYDIHNVFPIRKQFFFFALFLMFWKFSLCHGFCVFLCCHFCWLMVLWIFRLMARRNWSKSSLMLGANNGFLEVSLWSSFSYGNFLTYWLCFSLFNHESWMSFCYIYKGLEDLEIFEDF